MRRAVDVGTYPLATEVAVVNPGAGRVDQREARAVDRHQVVDDRPRERDRSRDPRQLRRREELLEVTPDVEVADAQLGERLRHGLAQRSIGLGPQREVDAAETREAVARGVGERDDVGRQCGVHRELPSTERATRIRCTSMVPEETVAAWA
jgi:hypothetical protein